MHAHMVTHTNAQVSTLIGYGSPNKADSHDVHGAPLGAEETVETRKNLKWDFGEFEVPQDVLGIFRQVRCLAAAAAAATALTVGSP